MKIALIAHVRHPIAPPFMGGMEAHSHLLAAALERRGHEVTLFAASGSDGPRLVPICGEPYEAVLPWAEHRGTPALDRYQARAFGRAWAAVLDGGFDMVHNNTLFPGLLDWAREDRVPMVTSQHVPPFGAMRDAVGRARDVAGTIVTVTSADQRRLWNDVAGSNLRIVHNGVDTGRWRPAASRGERAVWYGRITPNKGLEEAVAAARIAGVPLDIAGNREDPDYFDRAMAGARGGDTRYLGQLHGPALERLVAAARLVLVTPMWDEPFGLVAAEALACDVPVAGFDRGALAEVVGSCGRLVPAGDVQALAEALRDGIDIELGRCRARALERFSIEAMLGRYEQCYAAAIGSLPARSARASSQSSTAALLA